MYVSAQKQSNKQNHWLKKDTETYTKLKYPDIVTKNNMSECSKQEHISMYSLDRLLKNKDGERRLRYRRQCFTGSIWTDIMLRGPVSSAVCEVSPGPDQRVKSLGVSTGILLA